MVIIIKYNNSSNNDEELYKRKKILNQCNFVISFVWLASNIIYIQANAYFQIL